MIIAIAPGGPGSRPTWTSSAKDMVTPLSPASTSDQSSGLTYRRLPSANYKCLLNSFLNVGNKLLVA
jgi:hypothetical protein